MVPATRSPRRERRGVPLAGTTPLASLPGLTRQSIHLRKNLFAKKMDARVISEFTRVFDALLPAHDDLGKLPSVSPFTIILVFSCAFARGVISFASLIPNRVL